MRACIAIHFVFCCFCFVSQNKVLEYGDVGLRHSFDTVGAANFPAVLFFSFMVVHVMSNHSFIH